MEPFIASSPLVGEGRVRGEGNSVLRAAFRVLRVLSSEHNLNSWPLPVIT